MKKMMTIMGAILLTASTVQMASAGQRDKARQVERMQPAPGQQYRGSNAYYAPGARDWRDDGYDYGYSNRLQSLSEGGAISAPAGR